MEFIVSEIEAEAIRAGRPLREPERRLLFFSETGSGAREVAETFEAEGRQDEYEQRIARLIRAARQRADRQRAAAWRAAVQRVAGTDCYLAVMLDESVRRGSGAVAGRNIVSALVVICVALGVYALVWAGLAWYLGHEPSRGERFFYAWVAAVTCTVAYMASRWAFGPRRVDDSIGRVLDVLFRTVNK